MDSRYTPLLINAAFSSIGPFPLAIKILNNFSKKYSISSEISVVSNELGEVKLKFYFSKQLTSKQINELIENFIDHEELNKIAFVKEKLKNKNNVDVMYLDLIKEEKHILSNIKEKYEKNT